MRRTRRRSRGCARTLLSHCRSRQTARPKEALPPHASAPKERKGVAVNGGLGSRMYESRANSRLLRRVLAIEAPRCAATRGVGSRERRRADIRGPWRATPRVPDLGKILRMTRVVRSAQESVAQSPLERAEQEQRILCRSKASRTGEDRVASRRRGRSGLGDLVRIGPRVPRKAREKTVPVSSEVATGASEARSNVARGSTGTPHGELGKMGRTRPHGVARSAEANGAS